VNKTTRFGIASNEKKISCLSKMFEDGAIRRKLNMKKWKKKKQEVG
jgi:hypothetical protein